MNFVFLVYLRNSLIIKTSNGQAENFIIYMNNCNLSARIITKQIKKIYITKNRSWINKIILLINPSNIRYLNEIKGIDTLSKLRSGTNSLNVITITLYFII